MADERTLDDVEPTWEVIEKGGDMSDYEIELEFPDAVPAENVLGRYEPTDVELREIALTQAVKLHCAYIDATGVPPMGGDAAETAAALYRFLEGGDE